MPLDRSAAPAGEQAEPFVEALCDLGGRHHPDAGGGQLDRERDAVEAPADLRDRLQVLGRSGEAATGVGGAIEEEAHRFVLGQLFRAFVLVRNCERADRHEPFAVQPEALPTRREHSYAGASERERLHEARGRGNEVLTVVQDEQDLPITERGDDAVGQRLPRTLRDRQGRGDEVADPGRVRQRTELAQPRAGGEPGQHLGRGLHRQPRLADTADAGQRDDPYLSERRRDLVDLVDTADERRELLRQVRRIAVHPSKLWEVTREFRMQHLEDVFRVVEIAQTVFAEVDQGHAFG